MNSITLFLKHNGVTFKIALDYSVSKSFITISAKTGESETSINLFITIHEKNFDYDIFINKEQTSSDVGKIKLMT